MKKRQFILDIKGEEEEGEDFEEKVPFRIPPPRSSPWEEIAKFELEELLGCATEYKKYEYYERLGGFHIKSLHGAECENGESEWIVFRNDDEARDAAIAYVKSDLEDDPGNFNEGFIVDHLNADNFEAEVREDAEEGRLDYGAEDFQQLGYINPELDINSITDEMVEDARKRAVDDDINEALRMGIMPWFRERYGRERAAAEAIEHLGIYIDQAAEDAVDTDGVAYFLDRYDGEAVELPSGAVAFGVN